MCENFKKIIAVMSIAIMAMSAGLPVFAKEGSGFDNLSPEEVYQYLLDRGVSSEQLNLLNDEMCSHNSHMAVGCVWRADNDENIDQLLKEADERMYEDKRIRYEKENRNVSQNTVNNIYQ